VFSCTGLSPSTATPSRGLPLTQTFSHSPPDRQIRLDGPTTPTTQRLPAITCNRFSLIRFRSPLLTESRLFSLPVGTEMFHFPTFPPHALCVQARVTPHDWCGVPPFGNPRINARLTAPRGLSQPPTSFIGSWCPGIHRVPLTTWPHKNPTQPPPEGDDRAGLQELSNKLRVKKMLASTVQFSTYDQTPITPPPPDPHPPQGTQRYEDQTGPDTKQQIHPATGMSPLPQDPTACLRTRPSPPPRSPRPRRDAVLATMTMPAELVSVPPSSTTPGTRSPSRWRNRHALGAALDHIQRGTRPVLLRKEVIQPHLPVRLPCYDFVPIADPAFDGSLHKGWATGFGRYRLS
jgi:hypothetical protein